MLSSTISRQQSLQRGVRIMTGGGRQGRVRNGLVIREASLACVVLIGAGLMMRSAVAGL
jgi:preprotein translocase subunit YajC